MTCKSSTDVYFCHTPNHLPMRFFLVLLVSTALLSASCEKRNRKLVTIEVDASSMKDSVFLEAYTFSALDKIELGQLRLDSLKTGVLRFEIAKPLLITININKKQSKVYLEPGFKAKLVTGDFNSGDLFTFEGDGAELNNYFSRTSSIIDVEIKNGLWNLSEQPFIEKIDSLEKVINDFTNSYLATVSVSEKQVSLLNKVKQMHFLSIKEEYAFMLHNGVLIEQFYAFREGREQEKFVMPPSLKINSESVLLDTTLYSMQDSYYRTFLFFYLNEDILSPLWDTKKLDKPKYGLAWKSHLLIKDGKYLPPIKEHLMAMNTRNWMDHKDLASEIDSVFADFKNQYPNSHYLTTLQKEYNKKSVVSMNEEQTLKQDSNTDKFNDFIGKDAPNFSGMTPDGKMVSLSDLKGKVVYVDVWATWCGPCRDEMSDSKKLNKEFQENEQVTFLYVSVDKNEDKWKQVVTGYEELKGSHIIVKRDNLDSFNKDYLVTYIPRYFLIDKLGKVVSINAPRPSSGGVKNEIMKLITP